jgi:hypothetical protein
VSICFNFDLLKASHLVSYTGRINSREEIENPYQLTLPNAATGQEQLSFSFWTCGNNLNLWIYLRMAETRTSQPPITQTAWLKVTPHCNHCNPLDGF